jgi:site-specific recombinase XerD
MTELAPFPALNDLSVEKLKLSGVVGENRETDLKCQIRASNDLEAVLSWLERYQRTDTTYKSYKKESERLLLWCLHEKRKALSDLDAEDFEDYFSFLQNPPVSWCSSNGSKRGRQHSDWRPLVKPMSLASLNITVSIIHSLMDFLYQARYLQFNPLSLRRGGGFQKCSPDELKMKTLARILEEDEWTAFKEHLFALPESSKQEKDHKVRLRFVVAMLFLLGLRINELATHTWAAFRQFESLWWFCVRGKGGKVGMIPVNDELLEEIQRYRIYLSLSVLPQSEEDEPIITSVRNHKRITTRQLYRLLKNFANAVAGSFPEQHKQEKLRRFSPHWLRHLSATQQDKSGILFKHIQANHRHEAENTTRRYVHALDQDRHSDMGKLKLFLAGLTGNVPQL